MYSKRSRLIGAIAVFLTLALAISCRGFFVNPTLTSVSVGPQNLQLQFNQTWQMSATGTYSDGTQKTLTSGVTWSIAATPSGAASIGQTSGIVTASANTAGTATVTASAGSCSGCSGSTTVTIIIPGVTSITVNGGGQTVHTQGGVPVYLTAQANGSFDVTNQVTWTVKDPSGADATSNFTLSFVSGSGEGFLPASNLASGTYTATATYSGSVSGSASLIVQNP